MPAAEIAAMHFASTGHSMDALIEPRKTRADLDLDAVRNYMRNATQQGRRHLTEHGNPWQVLQKVFFDLGLIERYGGGIQRILAACESAGLPPPELENAQGGFRMVFKQAEESRQTPDPIAKSAPPPPPKSCECSHCCKAR